MFGWRIVYIRRLADDGGKNVEGLNVSAKSNS
jgi:hypothetical protein